MRNLLIMGLVLALAAALFLTRPHQADFEQFARANKLTDAKPTGGPSIVETITHQLQKFGADVSIVDPTEAFLKKCSYDNYFIFENVNKDGQVIYTGMVGHWFKRSADTPVPVAAKP